MSSARLELWTAAALQNACVHRAHVMFVLIFAGSVHLILQSQFELFTEKQFSNLLFEPDFIPGPT